MWREEQTDQEKQLAEETQPQARQGKAQAQAKQGPLVLQQGAEGI